LSLHALVRSRLLYLKSALIGDIDRDGYRGWPSSNLRSRMSPSVTYWKPTEQILADSAGPFGGGVNGFLYSGGTYMPLRLSKNN
jgi:hypothetical protein